MKKDELRKKAEESLKGNQKSIDNLSKMEMSELIHEFRVNQKELEMQNDELRELQYRLEEVRDKYTDLFDFAPVGYFILNRKGVIKNANLTACSMLNIERSKLNNTPFTAFVSKNEDSFQKFYNHLSAVFKSDKLESCVILMNKRNGDSFYAQLDSLWEVDVKEEVKQCRLIIRDLTSEIKAKSDIEQALKKEIQLNKMKSQFVSMASHEFRTPLTTVLSSANLLCRYIEADNNKKKQKVHVNRIKSSIFHITSILTEFLSLDNIDRGLIQVNKIEFDIIELTSEVLDSFELIMKKGQSIKFDHEGSTLINTDRNFIRNILNNLLSNAIKYSANDTEIIFKIVLDKNILIISVEDYGIGIPKDDYEQLFSRFYRARNVSNIEGTGLGLNIVDNYLNLLGGKISFESEIDVGTKFTVVIPV